MSSTSAKGSAARSTNSSETLDAEPVLRVLKRNSARVRVRFAETDQMGVVYHSNYLIWMEVGRVELCRALGIRYRDMEAQDGILLAVAEATCRYVSPAKYDDEVDIDTWIETSHPRMVVFAYEMKHAETGAVLAKAQTKHIFCGPDLKPTRLPAKYHAAFAIKKV